MADYSGLDPSVMSYLQGGGMPAPMPDQPSPYDAYGLPPSVTAGLQNGFAPEQVASTLGPRGGSIDPPQPIAAPIASPTTSTLGPRGRNNFGVDPSVAGAPGSPEVADTQVPSVTGGALPSQEAPAPIATQPLQPDQVVGTAAPLSPQQLAASNKAYDKQQAAAAAQANSVDGTFAQADVQNRAVIDKERQAQADADAAEIAKNTALDQAQQDLTARQVQQEKEMAVQRNNDLETTAKYTHQYAQQIKDAADYKVDTNRDIGLGGAIAVALSGIGDAIAHRNGPNAALQIITSTIDKRIADDWAKKKSLGDTANDTKGLIDASRQSGLDDRQNQDIDRAALLTNAKNKVASIITQSANPAVRARGEQINAGIDQQIANLTTGLGQRKLAAQKDAQDQANKVAERGIQWAGIKQNDVHFNKTLDAQQKENDRNFALRVGEYNAQGNVAAATAAAAKAKDLKENGVYDPNSADLLLDASNPDAVKALAHAKQLDQLAAAQADPQQQAALAKQASDIRTQAKLDYGAIIEDKDGALKKQLGGAQRLINATQRIREALDSGSITDRDTRADLKTEADNAFTAWATANDVKASSREYEVYKEAMGAIDGVSSTNVNKGPLKASLDALDKGAQGLTGTILRGHGIKAIGQDGNPWVMTAEKLPTDTKTLSGKTSAELGSDATPGVAAGLNPVGSQGFAAKAGRAAARAVFGGDEPDPVVVAENAANTGPSGLAKDDDAKVLGMIRSYGKVSPDENRRVLADLVRVVGDPGGDERKQAAANSVITRVRSESPVLYKKLLDELPADRRKEITKFDLVHPAIVKAMGWHE